MTATLRNIALLAGLRPGGDQPGQVTAGAVGLGTCLDGGGEAIVSLAAPGGRRLGVFERDRRTRNDPGCSRWSWWKQERGFPVIRGSRVLLAGEPPGTWDMVTSATGGGTETLRHWHRVLGLAARIYSITAEAGAGPDGVWVAWQLDPGVPVNRALGALGGWSAPAEAAVDTLGALVPARLAGDHGPWSLAVRADGEHVRIGTARWARWHEDDAKRRRAVAAVAAFGGDARFVEGAYKLALASEADPGHSRVGRAAEIELARTSSGDLAAPHELELFLAIGRP
jgi:hypothetical protein